MQGPTELLPVSSSGHMVLLGSRDKAFDVFVHTGTAAALLVALPRPRLSSRAVLTVAPAAVAGLALQNPIERKLGRRSVGVGQLLGGAALLAADRAPEQQSERDVTARDALLIGVAQASALVPGVSRNGATLTAARLLGFRRADAARMSRDAALPVILGATALKLVKRSRITPPGGAQCGTASYAAGCVAAFASTLAAARLVPLIDRLPYTPIAAYRIALGLVMLRPAGRWA